MRGGWAGPDEGEGGRMKVVDWLSFFACVTLAIAVTAILAVADAPRWVGPGLGFVIGFVWQDAWPWLGTAGKVRQ